ncbi:molybdopterin biosynthesis MoeA protein, partial [mine drainage metagenome]
MRAQHVASAIAVGVDSIEVYRILELGIISTGGEIVPDGDVKNTTQPLLASYFSTPYLHTHDLGVVPDEKVSIRDAVKKVINSHDMIVVTGGTSLGAKDLVVDALDELGDMVFGGVMIRPGRTISVYDIG